MTEDGRLPLYDEVAARLLFDPIREQQGEADMSVVAFPDADAWTGVTRENLPVTERPGGDPAWRPMQ